MRGGFAWAVLLLALLSCVAAAWTKDDHEIFDLVSELETHEGKGTDFYKFLDVAPGASAGALNKAYRKRSLELHPDKNPNTPEVHARFARLGKVNAILRNGEKRERYDHFYKNGVPRWRGTGYYYARYRPGILEVILFLVLLTSGVHYLILRLNHAKDLARVAYFRRSALRAAGVSADVDTPSGSGSGLGLGRAGKAEAAAAASAVDTALSQAVQGAGASAGETAVSDSAAENKPAMNRKERRAEKKSGPKATTPLVSRSGTATPSTGGGAKEVKRRKVKVPLIEGSDRAGSLDLVVIDRDVFVPEHDGELTPLSSLAGRPSITALWPIKLARSVVSAATSAVSKRDSAAFAELEDEEDEAPTRNGRGSSRRSASKQAAAPASTDEDDAEDGEDDGEDGAATAADGTKKKRRNGNGKVAGMRRRKALAAK